MVLGQELESRARLHVAHHLIFSLAVALSKGIQDMVVIQASGSVDEDVRSSSRYCRTQHIGYISVRPIGFSRSSSSLMCLAPSLCLFLADGRHVVSAGGKTAARWPPMLILVLHFSTRVWLVAVYII